MVLSEIEISADPLRNKVSMRGVPYVNLSSMYSPSTASSLNRITSFKPCLLIANGKHVVT